MRICTSCDRHLLVTSQSCPFCSQPSALSKVTKLLGVGSTMFILSACYGVPYKETGPLYDTGPTTDLDGDGFLAIEDGGEDCDDTSAWINPDADEICDDEIDNDCDGDVDADDMDCA